MLSREKYKLCLMAGLKKHIRSSSAALLDRSAQLKETEEYKALYNR